MNREEFVEAYKKFSNLARSLAEKSKREGILSLEEELDWDAVNERDFFHHGLRFVIDGLDPTLIDKILTNILEQEKDEYARKLKLIQKDALLGIQAGYNPRVLGYLLNSHTDLAEDFDTGGTIKLIPLPGYEDEYEDDEQSYEQEEGKYDGEV